MKIAIVRPPLQQSSVNVLRKWVKDTETLYTNSDVLQRIRPNTKGVAEPTHEQLMRANAQHEIVFVYPNEERLRKDAFQLHQLPGIKRVLLDGQPIKDLTPYLPLSKNYKPKTCLNTPNGKTLRQYQQQIVDFTLDRKRVGLFVDMGLGKTLATLAAVNQLFEEGKIDKRKPILVIAPKMVALDTWSREAEKWGYDIDVCINIGLTKKKRDELFENVKQIEKPTILTTNPEQLHNIQEVFRDTPNPFDVIIVDELSLFKSASSKRFKLLHQLTEDVPYFIGLTGTPAPNSLLDIWSQLMLINPEMKYALGHTFYQYRNAFFEPDMVDARKGIVYSYKLKRGAENAIYQKIEPYVISLRGNQLIDIPEVTYSNQYVRMSERNKDTYRYLDKQVRKEIKELEKGETIHADTGKNTVSVANAAVLKSKLLQLATGAMYDVDEESTNHKRAYTVFHDEKIHRLKEIVETANSPILVFYNFISDLERITEAIPSAKVLNTKDKNVDKVIAQWNRGEIPLLLANPKSTGHGLNLQDGGHIIVWFSLTWNNEIYRQANKRIHRSGQQYPVQIIHIITKDTADEEILPRLNGKEEQQQELLSVLEV